MSKKPAWKLHPESAMMTYGHDPQVSDGAVVCPEYYSTVFTSDMKSNQRAFKNQSHESTFIYSRVNYPSLRVFEKRLALWEEAESCVAFSSGMAAIFAVSFEFLRPGNVLLYNEPLYGGSAFLFKQILPNWKIKAIGFNKDDIEQKIKASRDRLGMIYIETPSNPTNGIVDIGACKKLAKENTSEKNHPIITVDNTFLGPLFQHPLEHGADISLYSATKYISGHSDVIAGACVGSKEYMDRLRKIRMFLGSILNPDATSRLLKSLQTLKLRMQRQTENAQIVAGYLNKHPKVERVYFPSLIKSDSPDFHVYNRQCLEPGAVVSFNIIGGKKPAYNFLDSLKLFTLSVSLGSNESLAQHPYTMTHASVSVEEKRRLGITNKMIRLSIGIENSDDIISDLEQALNRA